MNEFERIKEQIAEIIFQSTFEHFSSPRQIKIAQEACSGLAVTILALPGLRIEAEEKRHNLWMDNADTQLAREGFVKVIPKG